MKKILVGLLIGALASPAWAADNAVIVTPGSGLTMKSKDVGAGVQAMQPIMSDALGNPVGTSGNPIFVQLNAGAAVIGAVTQSGAWTITTLPALVAGTAVIGKVGIDQTTPGVTNGVQITGTLPAFTSTPGVTISGTLPAYASTPTFLIGGTLPAFGSTPTFNLGTLNGAATAAKQAAFGVASTPSLDVYSVQGVAGGTPQPISGFDDNVAFTPTVQAAAYTNAQSLGGLQTVSVFRVSTQPSGVLAGFQLASKNNSIIGYEIFGWTKNPTGVGSFACTDKATFVDDVGTVATRIPGFPFVATPVTAQGSTISSVLIPIIQSVKNKDTSPTTNLYFCIVPIAAVTPASTTELVGIVSLNSD